MPDRNDSNGQKPVNRQPIFQSSETTQGAAGSPQPGRESREGKTEGKASLLPAISVPKGGGAIRGIDEKFSVNPATGTGSMSIPLPVSPGRAGFQPQLALSYDSGAGNGPFGLGWDLSLPAITRKTDKGLPKYQDENASDLFIISGAEDLVPALKEEDKLWKKDVFTENEFRVQRYRPRTEGLFARIEKWHNTSTGEVFWKSVTPDNLTSIFGRSASCRISDPEDGRRVFSWLLEESHDDKGNVIVYEYKQENSDHLDPSLPQEGGRLQRNRSFANRHIKRIKYGNQQPGVRDHWLFEVVFDYGEHDTENPSPDETQPWPVRLDPFSFYRAGFEIRTYRLCRRVLMFHHFSELGPEPCLVNATEFQYQEDFHLTPLIAVHQSGYRRKEDGTGYLKKSLPPVEFGYTQARIDEQVREIDPESLENLPSGLNGGDYQWVDLDGEGLSGVLTHKGDAWYYKRNLGGRFAPLQELVSQPSLANGGGELQLMDVDGNGRMELVLLDEPVAGFFEKNHEDGWDDFVDFAGVPNVDWKDPNLRLIDLTGDGHADIFISRDDEFIYFPSKADEGFDAPTHVRKALDEEEGPALVFADREQSVFLADMSGGGLTDIVRIRNGEVCYWPNLGYGRFGAKIVMDNPPFFDHPDQFDPRRIRLADIDGSGTTDIIYLNTKSIRIYLNRAGNDWSGPIALNNFPEVDNLSSVAVMDLLGNGTACLVWSSPLPSEANRPVRYIDLMGGIKPHLLITTKDNMGSETRLEYAPSTKFYLQDRADDKPWITKLPFPVHVVEKVEVREEVTNTKLATTYSYHHGFFDGVEREFRGFGFVEQLDTESFSAYNGKGLFTDPPAAVDEEFYQPPVLTKTWFHTGAYQLGGKISQYFLEEYYQGDKDAVLLPDTLLPEGLTAEEEREACRALRGSMLRQEVYALDGTPESEHPYTVTEQNFQIRLVQPELKNPHAVFFTHANEALSYHYERHPDDPRIGHQMTLEVDKFGVPRKTVAIGYPRRSPAFDEQARTHITYSETEVIHKADQPDFYRLGVPKESRAYEITGLDARNRPLFRMAEIISALAKAGEIRFEEQPENNVIQKRLLGRACSRYYNKDLSGPLPFGEVEFHALPFESYQMALTHDLVSKVFGERVTAEMLEEGKFFDLEGDGNRWIPSGRAIFDPTKFYLPVEAIDPFGAHSFVTYDRYSLLVESARDPLGNIVTSRNDYRLLQADLVTDPNGNRQAVAFDELGMVIKTAVMGKEGETDPAQMGDTLDDPTARMEYELFNWMLNGKPNFVHTFAREKHGAENPRFQESYVYSDGVGREVLTKIQAEPGLAPARDEQGNLRRDENGKLLLVDTAPEVRWVGNGRTVFDNKGNPVKQYEPFFSATPEYEEEADLVEFGVTPILRYDPLGRLIRTDLPNGTFSKVEFDPWQQISFDGNDTVLESRWHADRIGGSLGPEEQRAAQLTEAHANTPAVAHLDTLGRTFLTIADNAAAGRYAIRVVLDIEGNQREVIDDRDRVVMRQDYDLLNNKIHQSSMEAGERWMLNNVTGEPIRSWNSRGFMRRMTYDALRRPLDLLVDNGEGEKLAEKIVYGEAQGSAQNHRGKVYLQYDGAGVVTNEAYDFKGNLLRSSRQLLQNYKDQVDWSQNPALENETFTSSTTYDALNLPVTLTSPDGSVVRPAFNEANLLERVEVNLRGAAQATTFVSDIDYNAKGQRELIEYGNGVTTTYEYDDQTFRLTRLQTLRGSSKLQDLFYTYDPVGNITSIRDEAQQTIYFNNQVVSPSSEYMYDAIYRLSSAEGREHIGQQTQPETTWNDEFRVNLPHPHDGNAMRRYTEDYEYDEVGNILEIIHQANNGNWTRTYTYDETSLLEAAKKSNRLTRTAVGASVEAYTHDAHGNMTSMPHLQQMTWDFEDQLHAVDLGGGGKAYYVYDAGGQRVRKVWEKAPGLREERIYLGGFEVFRKRDGSGTITLARETLHIMDDKQRIALIETRTQGNDGSPAQLIRYQFSNHLGSAALELDNAGATISYEEYYPYGSTSYQAARSQNETPNRYRHAGKERDEESGLYYHGARYYAPWLGRWPNPDPMLLPPSGNTYSYCNENPVVHSDPSGLSPTSAQLGAPTQQSSQGRVDPQDYLTFDEFAAAWPDKVTSTEYLRSIWDSQTRQGWTARALKDAGIDPKTWDPRKGFSYNKQNLIKVYEYYARLYRQNSRLRWAAMAKVAGGEVYRGLTGKLQRMINFGQALADNNPNTIDLGDLYQIYANSVMIILLEMQKDIFYDLAWQHQAYVEGGIRAIDMAWRRGELSTLNLVAWEMIDTNSPKSIREGNKLLLYREQSLILQGGQERLGPQGQKGTQSFRSHYARIQNIPDSNMIPESMSEDTLSPIPSGRRFSEVVPGGDITVLNDRWKWITEDMLPRFENLHTRFLTMLVRMPLSELAKRPKAYQYK